MNSLNLGLSASHRDSLKCSSTLEWNKLCIVDRVVCLIPWYRVGRVLSRIYLNFFSLKCLQWTELGTCETVYLSMWHLCSFTYSPTLMNYPRLSESFTWEDTWTKVSLLWLHYFHT
jgi:hypothetical protein